MLRLVFFLFLLFPVQAALAAPGQARVSESVLNTLASAPVGKQIEVHEFPAGPGMLATLTFRRIDVYAPDARIIVIDAAGQHEIPRSPRVHLLGYSKDGRTRVALSFDPDLAKPPYGAGSGITGAFEIRSERIGNTWQFTAISAEAALPSGVKLDYPANDDSPGNPAAQPPTLDHLIPAEVAGGPLRFATIAVDTDVSFMTERFGGNEINAAAWIADLFAQMNVMYERDLDVRLLQGTTFFRPASDPYPNTDTPASQDMLTQFGTYWQNNYTSGPNAVSRAFAMLLSGNASSGNSASGIAWVNAYCLTAGSFGSYSTNQVFTNSGIAVSFTATLVGHEIGHNFGAAHTHCSNTTTGNYPTSTNTIDQCSNAGTGCYSGTTSCPTSGPGAPRGSVMSYCNLFNGGACGQNVLQFHPTHITQVRNRIAANTPSCLITSDVIFANGFQ